MNGGDIIMISGRFLAATTDQEDKFRKGMNAAKIGKVVGSQYQPDMITPPDCLFVVN